MSNSLRFTCLLLFPLIFFHQSICQQASSITGTVTDASTGEPLIAANIRVLGTSKGTITNALGKYVLSLESGTYAIVYSYLGYRPDTLKIALTQPLVQNVELIPSPIQFPEVAAVAEDPAYEIIRKAIETKHSWMDKMHSYTFEAFTRQVLRRDTAIASITESYTTGFMKAGDTLREIVRQRRQTENIPTGENLTSVRRIVNFNDDEIVLFNFNTDGQSNAFRFMGPTAPQALENYEYRLLRTSTVNGIDVYTIRMTPKTRLKPLFDGTITIADETFAVMGVDVGPNESFAIPFVKDIALRYRQQFALYDSLFWMPTDIQIDGGFSVSIVGISLPRIGINAVSSIYEYAINAPLPDSVFGKPRLTVDSTAVRYDSLFWKTHEVLPLTVEEQSAYRELDSTQTLEKQFQPGGPLAAIAGDGTESFLNHVDVHFNRVEGFYMGGKEKLPILTPNFQLEGSIGVGFSDQRIKYAFRPTLFTDAGRKFSLGGEMYNRLENVPDEGFYGPLFISLTALIDKNDYRDYYLARGHRFFAAVQPSKALKLTMSFISEQEYSLGSQTDYTFFSRSLPWRINPPITDGLLRSVRFTFRIGEEAPPLDIFSPNAFELSLEHSSPSIARSEFDFTRYHCLFVWSIPTFARSLLFPPTLRVRVSAGLGARDLPPQRLFALDSRASGYASFGVLHGSDVKEFIGDRFVMLNLEHNFRSLPFLLLNLPFLYRNSIELLIHGSVAQTWNGLTSTSNGWYSEAGIGISRIFDIIRTDITYRFAEPKRFFVTVSIATLF